MDICKEECFENASPTRNVGILEEKRQEMGAGGKGRLEIEGDGGGPLYTHNSEAQTLSHQFSVSYFSCMALPPVSKIKSKLS